MSRIHTVEQGETLIPIALRYGFGSWRKIWECPQNAELRRKRPNPHVLLEGDQVFIPDVELRVESCTAGFCHHFKLRRPRAFFRVLLDVEGRPLEGYRYRLEVASETMEGTTGARGLIEHEVAPEAKDAVLTLWLDRDAPNDEHVHVWKLRIGYLDPPQEITGAQGVLRNLRYYDGPINGRLDDRTREALIRFQRDYGLPEPHGTLDEATWEMLRSVHEVKA
jgi:hypothetical protein